MEDFIDTQYVTETLLTLAFEGSFMGNPLSIFFFSYTLQVYSKSTYTQAHTVTKGKDSIRVLQLSVSTYLVRILKV